MEKVKTAVSIPLIRSKKTARNGRFFIAIDGFTENLRKVAEKPLFFSFWRWESP